MTDISPKKSGVESLISAYETLSQSLSTLTFKEPVAYIYNPLEYARESHERYLREFGEGEKEVVFLGMNPGPFGMAQTGVPFGEISAVRDWLGIKADIGAPPVVHPKRPIQGFDCQRSEVSGKRLWGWAQKRFRDPGVFFTRFFVTNYCPLVFMEESGRNRTPDKLPADERSRLFEHCDQTLRRVVDVFNPEYVIGIGRFAEQRALIALADVEVKIARISHPSPANPKANRGWEDLIEGELNEIGVMI